jgi:hypothetical protein
MGWDVFGAFSVRSEYLIDSDEDFYTNTTLLTSVLSRAFFLLAFTCNAAGMSGRVFYCPVQDLPDVVWKGFAPSCTIRASELQSPGGYAMETGLRDETMSRLLGMRLGMKSSKMVGLCVLVD